MGWEGRGIRGLEKVRKRGEMRVNGDSGMGRRVRMGKLEVRMKGKGEGNEMMGLEKHSMEERWVEERGSGKGRGFDDGKLRERNGRVRRRVKGQENARKARKEEGRGSL